MLQCMMQHLGGSKANIGAGSAISAAADEELEHSAQARAKWQAEQADQVIKEVMAASIAASDGAGNEADKLNASCADAADSGEAVNRRSLYQTSASNG